MAMVLAKVFCVMLIAAPSGQIDDRGWGSLRLVQERQPNRSQNFSEAIEKMLAEEVTPVDRRLTRLAADYVSNPGTGGTGASELAFRQRVECVMSSFGDLSEQEKSRIASGETLEAGVQAAVQENPTLQFELMEDLRRCVDR